MTGIKTFLFYTGIKIKKFYALTFAVARRFMDNIAQILARNAMATRD